MGTTAGSPGASASMGTTSGPLGARDSIGTMRPRGHRCRHAADQLGEAAVRQAALGHQRLERGPRRGQPAVLGRGTATAGQAALGVAGAAVARRGRGRVPAARRRRRGRGGPAGAVPPGPGTGAAAAAGRRARAAPAPAARRRPSPRARSVAAASLTTSANRSGSAAAEPEPMAHHPASANAASERPSAEPSVSMSGVRLGADDEEAQVAHDVVGRAAELRRRGGEELALAHQLERARAARRRRRRALRDDVWRRRRRGPSSSMGTGSPTVTKVRSSAAAKARASSLAAAGRPTSTTSRAARATRLGAPRRTPRPRPAAHGAADAVRELRRAVHGGEHVGERREVVEDRDAAQLRHRAGATPPRHVARLRVAFERRAPRGRACWRWPRPRAPRRRGRRRRALGGGAAPRAAGRARPGARGRRRSPRRAGRPRPRGSARGAAGSCSRPPRGRPRRGPARPTPARPSRTARDDRLEPLRGARHHLLVRHQRAAAEGAGEAHELVAGGRAAGAGLGERVQALEVVARLEHEEVQHRRRLGHRAAPRMSKCEAKLSRARGQFARASRGPPRRCPRSTARLRTLCPMLSSSTSAQRGHRADVLVGQAVAGVDREAGARAPPPPPPAAPPGTGAGCPPVVRVAPGVQLDGVGPERRGGRHRGGRRVDEQAGADPRGGERAARRRRCARARPRSRVRPRW